MTPKEKAEELVGKFYDATDDHWNQDYVSKKCALIAVQEIISEFYLEEDVQIYWKYVQKEIEKL